VVKPLPQPGDPVIESPRGIIRVWLNKYGVETRRKDTRINAEKKVFLFSLNVSIYFLTIYINNIISTDIWKSKNAAAVYTGILLSTAIFHVFFINILFTKNA